MPNKRRLGVYITHKFQGLRIGASSSYRIWLLIRFRESRKCESIRAFASARLAVFAGRHIAWRNPRAGNVPHLSGVVEGAIR